MPLGCGGARAAHQEVDNGQAGPCQTDVVPRWPSQNADSESDDHAEGMQTNTHVCKLCITQDTLVYLPYILVP